jgi:penicillin-binding protein 2
MILGMYGLLFYRVYHLQISQHQHYKELAQQNQTRNIYIYPQRGAILDRNDKVIAKTQAQYYACYHQDTKTQHREFLIEKALQHDASKTCVELNSWDYAHINPWSDIEKYLFDKRYYPYAESTSHIVGYIAQQSFQPNNKSNQTQTMTGATGLEKQYDTELAGHKGMTQQIVNARGQLISSTDEKPASTSEPLHTTLDIHLQQKAYHELFSHSGTVIMLNPTNGELLCAVSNPSFNPHVPMQTPQYKNETTHLFNRITQAKYPPGSVLKPMIALMALEDGYIDPTETIDDQGYIEIGQQRFHDWLRTGHGHVDLETAIRVSCDVYFYQLAQKVGISRLVDYLIMFGFDKTTQIDIPHEKKGLIPTVANRKQRKGGWYEGHTVMTIIGQGDILVTPIALARATMLLANRGFDHQLHLSKGNDLVQTTPRIKAKPQHWETIHKALARVTKEGTAKLFKNSPYTIAGKTGSAQVKSIKTKAEYQSLPKHQKDHHLFIGFSPVENPEIAIVVITEHEHKAVVIAKHMLDFYWHNLTH